MKVLVIGSGGREHAIVWKLRQSAMVTDIFCAPGNAGIESIANLVPIKTNDLKSLLKFAKKEKIDLTVVGPEQPLVEGIVDVFEEEELKIFGPSKYASQLEGSKVFSKEFMIKYKIPTARYKSFDEFEKSSVLNYLKTLKFPVVVKADGLAAGKGVIICNTIQDAFSAIEDMMVRKVFGNSGNRVIVEEYLQGEEASVFVLTDGENYATLAPAQDHKRICDGDLGKNTGGMGAYAPTPLITDSIMERIRAEIIKPTLDGMKKEGFPYRGCLYLGLMITDDGPKVLEYNCRFGDPEAQVVIPLIDGDFAEILLAIAERRFNPSIFKIHRAVAVCVVMASQGYPDAYETGKTIYGLDNVSIEEGVVIFHAGTKKEGDRMVTSGGRVLGVTAVDFSDKLDRAILTAYKAIEKITFDGAYYRKDIGKKAFKYLKTEQK